MQIKINKKNIPKSLFCFFSLVAIIAFLECMLKVIIKENEQNQNIIIVSTLGYCFLILWITLYWFYEPIMSMFKDEWTMQNKLTRKELFDMTLDQLYEYASHHLKELEKIQNELKLRGNY